MAWTRPLRFVIKGERGVRIMSSFESPRIAESAYQQLPIITNSVGERFGMIGQLGKGRVFLLPPCPDNAVLVDIILTRMEPLKAIPIVRPTGSPMAPPALVEYPAPVVPGARLPTAEPPQRDVFLSYASEDKEAVARPLAELLGRAGLRVWFDGYELTIGDRLLQKIDQGLRASRYGVVILSHSFFGKKWPQYELDGLAALEKPGEKKILPVWHGLTADDVKGYSPMLAGIVAADTARGLGRVAGEIIRVIRGGSSG